MEEELLERCTAGITAPRIYTAFPCAVMATLHRTSWQMPL